MALLSLARGTKVVDAQGQPLSFVTLTVSKLTQRTDIGYVGSAYEFGPQGARLDPPASLIITFNPREYYPFQMPTIDPSRVYLAYLGEDGSTIGPSLTRVNRETGSVTAEIDHLGTFILYCIYTSPPYPGRG